MMIFGNGFTRMLLGIWLWQLIKWQGPAFLIGLGTGWVIWG
ncbi:hypothetical protein [Bacillus mycoides]|nr:hypothetical protein [Bacillus mycoides]